MYETILVPTDGTPDADRAAEHAVAIADRFDATLHALYVEDARGLGDHDPTAAADPAVDRERAAEAATERVAALARETDVPAETAVDSGDPDERIRERADLIDADMIVMGSHGKTGLSRVLLSSVADKVVREADVPVLTVGADGASASN